MKTNVEAALAAALAERERGSAAVQIAEDQMKALSESRAETAEKLEAAKGALREASAALARGASDKAFHAAMDQVAALEAKLRAFDDIAIPETQTALDAARAGLPCERRIAALEFRAEARRQLAPLYDAHAEVMQAQAACLAKIEEAHAALRAAFRGAYPTVFGPDRRSFLRELLQSVPPEVRAFARQLFTDQVLQPVHDDRAVQHVEGALEAFKTRVGEEPSPVDLAKFNGPIFQLPAPPPPPEPRPELGPPKMRGYVLSGPPSADRSL